MFRSLIVLSVLALILTACEKRQEAQAPQPQVQQEESGTDRRPGEPGESPAESGQAPTMGDIREAREETAAAGQPGGEPPAETARQPAAAEAGKKVAEAPKSEKEPKPAAGKPSPKAGAKAPETVVLPNKNGDITLPHQAHTQITDCKTCHGDKGPGKIDLDRDSGHKLCLGCHKEQGAGPTSCSGCHRKS